MATAEQVLHAWKEWGIQALVLLSLTIQVSLVVLAEFRRRFDSGVLRAFVWLAYMLADVTAVYVLGHMSVTSRSPEHRLMAFWAPFLLLHLGGQDNITAYAIEDNRLWLRHLQTLVVQVAAAAYVLHVSSLLHNRSLLRPATILMFVVGAAKYGERVWALWRADRTPLGMGNKYMSFENINRVSFGRSTQASTYIAHLLLDIPRDLMNAPLPHLWHLPQIYFWMFHEEAFKVAEMQLSLMHDVLYTKAEVQHSWCGIFIRVISSLAAIGAFIMFYLLDEQGESYSKADVTVTYILLVGALVLEITSLLRAIFSSWTCFLLVKWRFENRHNDGRISPRFNDTDEGILWKLLACVADSLYQLINAVHWKRRYWSSTMGQHNLLELCALSRASRSSKIATWMGFEDRWNTPFYSWSIDITARIRDLMLDQVILKQSDAKLHTVMARGRELYETMGLQAENFKLDESILIWHIATNIYLFSLKQERAIVPWWMRKRATWDDLADAVDALSNYMMFLLATRHYMLSPTATRIAYTEACYALTALEYSSPKDLVSFLRRWGNSLNSGHETEIDFPFTTNISGDRRFALIHSTTLRMGAQLGAKLTGGDIEILPTVDSLEPLKEVWLEMLFYAASECSGYSHAKQLSNGGELVTIASILVKYTAVRIKISRRTFVADAFPIN